MAISVKKQAAVPDGQHRGVIISAEETTKIFDGAKGPEPVVEIVIQPAWRQDAETETLPVSVSFSPVLNGLSALSKLLARLKVEPGASFEVNTLNGTEVEFTVKRNANDFVNVAKDSIRLAAMKPAHAK